MSGGDKLTVGKNQRQRWVWFKQIGSLNILVHFTPCHTKGHVTYQISHSNDSGKDSVPSALFTGDTLFIGNILISNWYVWQWLAGGCGRFFEGDGPQMYNSFYKVLGEIRCPEKALVFCGHEYTGKNRSSLHNWKMTFNSKKPGIRTHFRTQQRRYQTEIRMGSSCASTRRTHNRKPTYRWKKVCWTLILSFLLPISKNRYNPFFRVDTKEIAEAIGFTGKSYSEIMAEVRSRKDNWKG